MENKCHGCAKREINCHSTCEDYAKYRKWLDECNNKKRKEHKEYTSPYYRDGWFLHKKERG